MAPIIPGSREAPSGQFFRAWGHRGVEDGRKDRLSQSEEPWVRGHTCGLLGPPRACWSELRSKYRFPSTCPLKEVEYQDGGHPNHVQYGCT